MAFVAVPTDLNKVKSKVLFNLTQRQLICFGGAALVGVPFYLATKNSLGTSLAGLFMVLVMLPFFFLAMYEKDGLPFEKILSNYLRFAFTEQVRTYQTNNYYRQLEELPEFDTKEAKTVEAKRHRTHTHHPG